MVSLKTLLASSGLLFSLWQQPAGAFPTSPNYDEYLSEFPKVQRRAEDFYLRIMPLGASITRGQPAPEDTNGNGYRKLIRDQLRSEGWKVNMVGSVNYGQMADNDNEGWPGFLVSGVLEKAQLSLPNHKPNLVLINAGTNDAARNEALSTISQRMEALIIECFVHSPNAVVILSTLIPNRDNQGNTDLINAQYRVLAKNMKNQGYKVELAEMADGFITMDDIWELDGIHPKVSGFRKMAAVWRQAFGKVLDNKDWLKEAPKDVSFNDDDKGGGGTCPKSYGSGNADSRAGEQILTAASPFIMGDGPYKHSSQAMGNLKTLKIASEGVLYMAQLVNHGAGRGGERDELIYVDEDSSSVMMYENQGDGNFGAGVSIKIPDKCKTKGIHWGDVNNDGLDDFICIGTEGDMHVSINNGGNPPTFEFFGGYFIHPDGYEQKHVRLADIDGDGRLDYCVVADNGDVRCWRNGGLGRRAEYWQDLGKVAPGRGMGDLAGVRFVDINGDGLSDWMWLDEQGKVTTYINQRGDGKGMVPHWLETGVTHGGMGEDTEGRENIIFGRLYDSGRRDVSDGARWGDMSGTGIDDYVWISPDGQVGIFRNKNPSGGSTALYSSGWIDHGVVLKTGMDRKSLHIGDWDGDGKADIIGAAESDGSLTVWKTKFDGKDFSFDKKTVVDSGKCSEGWGLGFQDIGVMFADITGSGCVDYICMEPNGRAVAWLNDNEGTMRYAGQIKYSEKKDRANHRFADVNGDGKADFLWIDKFSGDATVWYNNGELPNAERLSGSKFHWVNAGVLSLGSARGPNMHYPNVGGVGRADQVEVMATEAYGYAWYNTCPAGGDDGDGEVQDPGLPDYNPGEVSPPDDPGSGDDGAVLFCDSNEGSWSPNLWNKLAMGDWFEARSRLYSSRGWPLPSDGSLNGIPRVIARFNLDDEDKAFNWDVSCNDIDKACNLVQATLKENCHQNWQRAFSLWNMAGFAKFLQLWVGEFKDSGFDTILSLPLMSSAFMPGKTNVDLDKASWNTFIVGLLGGIASYAPGVPGGGFGLASSIMVMQGAMMSWTKAPTYDPRFDTYADLSSNYGTLRKNVKQAVTDYFDDYLKTLPRQGDEAEGTKLARIIADGAFTDQDILGNFDQEMLYRCTTAPMISEIWNAQKVFILKFPRGKIDFEWEAALGTKTFKYDPCFGSPKFDGLMKDKTYCDDLYNYVILAWDRLEQNMFADYGTAEDTLAHFNLTKQDVVKSAQWSQLKSWQFMPRDAEIFGNLWIEMAENPTGALSKRETLAVNIPVCELEYVDVEWTKEACFQSGDGEEQFQQCLLGIVLNSCSNYVWQSHPWPYAK
ncbi:hypothetical protein AK830_g7215 [Neonectria ditissima]|uniref:SGNH hydrolase-type esterase domain-containing protein n=1 Tax=Neonectria ditissima TaxID=78410 RepID=A0A0P7B096_9HYPO|nr:hypothetical protein AK830_g7215 [Neonectria ditissima]